jgi:CheY-like chemotaxis protein
VSIVKKNLLRGKDGRKNLSGTIRKNIWVIDDNAFNVLGLEMQLKDFGLKIVKFYNSLDAWLTLQTLSAVELDLIGCIITDLEMPGMNGFEFVQKVRAGLVRGSLIPVIACTGGVLPKEMFLAEGFNDMLLKPVTREDLTIMFERFLRDA